MLRAYSAALIDRYAEMSATGALMFYGLFVMSDWPLALAIIVWIGVCVAMLLPN